MSEQRAVPQGDGEAYDEQELHSPATHTGGKLTPEAEIRRRMENKASVQDQAEYEAWQRQQAGR